MAAHLPVVVEVHGALAYDAHVLERFYLGGDLLVVDALDRVQVYGVAGALGHEVLRGLRLSPRQHVGCPHRGIGPGRVLDEHVGVESLPRVVVMPGVALGQVPGVAHEGSGGVLEVPVVDAPIVRQGVVGVRSGQVHHHLAYLVEISGDCHGI